MKVLGFAGSLREASYNRALLRAAKELAPAGMEIEIFDIGGIPLYNEDVERAGVPAAVEEFRAAIRSADAILVAVPEYNHGVPGVLKNAIDWASRPPGQSALNGKPAALFGASPGQTGTARAQTQLRGSFVFTNTPALPQPEVLVFRAHEKFDAEGRLTDEATRVWVGKLLEALQDWATRLAR
ncbi:NAD(P)H-dependent oxidoreductase [Longimicrobium sp.]|uniref:NADPH-dependent FMN reductase n=1 Tax=Longimicrobium sp. TaxID=2029185 RepID=UPI002B728FB8|nr:NAD(P)H-dependent oxidoreductase [Longimicrobium sp.]HSU12841.1 NAD(P)H-dependent oxidoreductase [Longimicrobium sp.]